MGTRDATSCSLRPFLLYRTLTLSGDHQTVITVYKLTQPIFGFNIKYEHTVISGELPWAAMRLKV